jgi:hypothetical protein
MRTSSRSCPIPVAVLVAMVAVAGSPPAEAVTPGGDADEAAAVAALRAELDTLKHDYEARISALEQRLSQLESAAAAPAAQAPPAAGAPATAEVPAGAAGAGGPRGALPVYGAAAAGSKIFNPDVAAIGNFLGAAGPNPQSGQPTFQLAEAELSFQAVVDPYARADFFLTFSPEEVGVEESYISFTELPGGFMGRVGKFKATFGKVNTFHPHTLPWTDKPLVSVNLVGGAEGISQSGLGVARLIPNDWVFLEATGEVTFGTSEVFDSPQRQDLTWLGRLHAYRDLTDSANVDVGGSFMYGTNYRGPGHHTRLVGTDVTFRWRPLRRAIYRSFLGRSELIWSRRDLEEGRADAFGFYLEGDYQFARRWVAGARYDWSERAEDPSILDRGGSLLLTFFPSEFSEVRGQYRHTVYGDGVTANEFLFQFLYSIGAHGAHPF